MIIQMKCRFFSLDIILGIVAAFLFCSISASAQSYIGGSFRFNLISTSSSGSAALSSSGTSLNVAPDLGWSIGDKWAVGIRPWVGFSSTTASDGNQSRYISVGINPYARYQLLGHRRFGLWAEADPELGFTQNRSETQDHVWKSSLHSTKYGVELVPVLTYQLNRHISLENRLHLFSLSLMGSHSVSSDGRDQYSFSGGLSATTKDIMDTLGDISIGFLYKF